MNLSQSTAPCSLHKNSRAIQERDSSDVPVVSYTRGKDLSGSMEGAGGIGGLLARSDSYYGHNYYHADGNGNVTYMLNSSQAMVARYRYDPFGNTTVAAGTMGSVNSYRFSSKMADLDTDLIYYGYRFYAPTLQRWLNRDPLDEPGFEVSRGKTASAFAGGPNRYLFVQNSPVHQIDPVGLINCDCPADRIACGLWAMAVCTSAEFGGNFPYGTCVLLASEACMLGCILPHSAPRR